MKAYPIVIFLAVLACVLPGGCGIKADSKSSASKIPWSRVKQVEVTTDTESEQQATLGDEAIVAPGASESEVILAWGMPQYILDSPAEAEHEIWQYPHAVVVFQGTKVQQVLAR
ncbi:MAG: hypothetical protein KAT11_03895 [Phycisphaerae bacterium]|nr:hypothetical protein [Phycisphaerae bacterium]